MRTLIGLFFLCFMTGAIAAPLKDIQWQGDPFVMISRGTPLASVLQEFGSNYGIPVVISAKITDQFNGRIQNKTPLQVITQLSRQYGLVWYYNTDVLYVYKTSELENEVLPLNNISTADVTRYLTNAGVLDKKACNIRPAADIASVQLVGVPVCISTVSKLTEKLDASAQQAAVNHEEVKVYKLNYASASDSKYSYRTQDVVVPGLVTVLQEMSKNLKGSANTSTGPTFAADPRQNAIIVKGSTQEQKTYSSIIKQLDVKPIMIEISVSIFDVDASNFNQLGVEWSASAKLGGGSISFNSDGGPSSAGSAGGSFSSVIGNTGSFMVKLNALQRNSKAKVLSRPSVVTLNNVQAVLDKNVTFYTKVSGEKVADLKSVTTGSLLRVTPRMIIDHGHKAVNLVLNIQDGQQGAVVAGSDGLPQVQNSEISTQATLKSGESLLIGGFVQDKDEETKNKLPLLGDLPLVGGLFRSTGHQRQSVMRLFLIKAEPVIQ
ncbi:EscC/YscC/HrcC family type III secretion system outer membrane ring protein [Parashewanella tropica]|uniref:EscC/YscC/HrcC family type III secretion system outer membrane ring protein n=1 Tax=Parashewanella tropica TaxID=2547970 RepID=UPI00105964EF|nr:EscC/YscC/HrcC family type III secretion system outer membrane ring protein [Parashewanella tropica]